LLELLAKLKQFSDDNLNLLLGHHDFEKIMGGNTVNGALRPMDFDTKTEVCWLGFREMACGVLVDVNCRAVMLLEVKLVVLIVTLCKQHRFIFLSTLMNDA